MEGDVDFRDAGSIDDPIRLRAGLSGPEGSGKTFTTLMLATEIARIEGGDACMVDTERGKSRLYAGRFSFQLGTLTDHSPKAYVEAIKAAERRFPVIGIDSLSHAWRYLVAYTRRQPNSYTAWAQATPMQDELIAAILDSPAHVICTMRSKVEYVQDRDEKGKSVVRKLGLQPIQRDDVGYEFDLLATFDSSNAMTVTKSRLGGLQGRTIVRPGPEVARTILDALAAIQSGAAMAPTPVTSYACTADGCDKTWTADDEFPGRNQTVSGPELARLGAEKGPGALCYRHLIAWMRGDRFAVDVRDRAG